MIGVHVLIRYLETNFGRIIIAAFCVIDRNNLAGTFFIFVCYGPAQIGRERGNAAAPGNVVAQKNKTGYGCIFHEDYLSAQIMHVKKCRRFFWRLIDKKLVSSDLF